jgi:dihydrofolate reductase
LTEDADFTLSLILAVADNGVIGRDRGLPWRLGSDLRRFRKLTMGHPLIMGRKTYEAIGKPLDGRDSIVVTRGAASFAGLPDSVFAARSVEEALALAKKRSQERGVSEAFVIGGAELFSLALPYATRIYLTRVHGAPEGDVRWEPPSEGWTEASRERREQSERDEYPVTDVILKRILGA